MEPATPGLPSIYVPPSPLRLRPQTSGRFTLTHSDHKAGEVMDIIGPREAILTGKPMAKTRLVGPLRVHQLSEQGRGLWMSDSLMELHQMGEFIRGAHGTVLVGGLGLGIVVRLLARNRRVKNVDVIERSADVIRIATSQRMPSRVRVHRDDVYRWLEARLGRSYPLTSCIFLDMWQGTGEATWAEEVAPARRIIGARMGRLGNIRTTCWAEDIMLGQVRRSLQVAMALPLDVYEHGLPHVQAWKRGILDRYPGIMTLEDFNKGPGGPESIRKLVGTPAAQELLASFVDDIGTPKWEKRFGQHWPAKR